MAYFGEKNVACNNCDFCSDPELVKLTLKTLAENALAGSIKNSWRYNAQVKELRMLANPEKSTKETRKLRMGVLMKGVIMGKRKRKRKHHQR